MFFRAVAFAAPLLAAACFAAVPPLPPIVEYDQPSLEFPPYYAQIDRARHAVFTGRYGLALVTLGGEIGRTAEGKFLRAQALAACGEANQAISLLNQLPRDAKTDILRSQILIQDKGDFAAALETLRGAVVREPSSIGLHYELARTLELSGELEAAKTEYAWFVEPPRSFEKRIADENDIALASAENLTLAARAVDRWAVLSGAYQKNEALHDRLINAFTRAYDQIDRQYWPARVAAAEYWIAHDNMSKAIEELAAAEELNPNDARINELLGLIAVKGFNFNGADECVAALRRIDQTSAAADLLEARTLLASRRPNDAEEPLRRVLERQPTNVTALALLAASHALRLHDERTSELLRDIDAIDPGNATAYFEVAEQLSVMRQYPRAVAMYKTAIERAPWWTEPRNGLGLLYTQSGDEDDARTTLDAAHVLDPFNLRTTNYLRLLDDLASFDKLETEHFIILYDSKLDPIIAAPMAEYLERVHGEICREFGVEPPVKTIIEVFPTHDAFSVRTTGSPWIGTVGASTGRVIALVSPRRGQGTLGAYNWAAVLRHEYTHTVTLAATDNRIPHWMTEGLAVYEERKPLPWDWVPLLYHAVSRDELFTIDGLTWGFVRPRRPTDRTLAYAQSFWVCRYLHETFGRDTVLEMLKMFREGKLQEEVIPTVTGQSVTQFEQDFFAWARGQIATWGYDEASKEKYDALRTRGEELIKSKNFADAVAVWEEIAQLRPVDAMPHQRLAGLYLTAEVNQPAKAIEHLTRLHDVEQNDNRYARRISRIYRDTNRLDDALRFAREATMIDPYDLEAQRSLLELLQRAGDKDALSVQQKAVAALEKWHEENKKRNRN